MYLQYSNKLQQTYSGKVGACYGLFNEAVSSLDYAALTNRMISEQ
jgi:hypothetical protein